MQTQNDRTVDALMEQLIESGPDGLAAAFVAMLNRAMRMERERANGALAYERSAARTAYANGYKPKKIDTPAGTLTVQVPKSRGGETPFYPQALERGRRSCRAVMLAVAQMYIQGSVGVASRVIVRPLHEERGLVAVPVLEGVDGRSAFQDGLRELAVVEADVAQDRVLQVLSAAEMVALEDVLDPACQATRQTGPLAT